VANAPLPSFDTVGEAHALGFKARQLYICDDCECVHAYAKGG